MLFCAVFIRISVRFCGIRTPLRPPQHYSKINFCDFRARVFLQSYVIMPGGRLRETQNKRIYQISGPKSGCGRFGNVGSGRLCIGQIEASTFPPPGNPPGI